MEASRLGVNEFLAKPVSAKSLLDRILSNVPDVEPLSGDELPSNARQANRPLQPTTRATRKAKSKARSRAVRG